MSYAFIAIAAVVVAYIVWKQVQGRNNAMFATTQRLDPRQYQADFAQRQAPHLLLDVRTPQEFASGHIAGAENISLQSLPQRIGEIPQDRPIVIYCRSGSRSRTAARVLTQAGYVDVYDLGGIIKWQAKGLPVH